MSKRRRKRVLGLAILSAREADDDGDPTNQPTDYQQQLHPSSVAKIPAMAKTSARKKAAKRKKVVKARSAKPTTRCGARSPELRKNFQSVVEKVREIAKKLISRFKTQGENDPTIDEWIDIKNELSKFAGQSNRALHKYDAVVAEIRSCGDVQLQQAVELADASGFGELLAEMAKSIAEQELEALAPLGDEQTRKLWDFIAALVSQAQVVSQLARKVEEEVVSPRPPLTAEQLATVKHIRSSLFNVVRAGIDLAVNVKHDPAEPSLQRVSNAVQAIEEYETALDAAKNELCKQASMLERKGRKELGKEVDAFTSRLEEEVECGLAIIDCTVTSCSAAIRLPKKAAVAANRLVDVTRVLEKKMLVLVAELSSRRGRKTREGDLADPTTLRPYHDLTDKERIVVDLMRWLGRERGPVATLSVAGITSRVRPHFKALGGGAGPTTIGNVLRSLRDASILFEEPGSRSSEGHGGAKRYRLTKPAADVYPPWTSTDAAMCGFSEEKADSLA